MILDLETSGIMKEPDPKECSCGSDEFKPRFQDNSPDVDFICKKCGKVHVLKPALDSAKETDE